MSDGDDRGEPRDRAPALAMKGDAGAAGRTGASSEGDAQLRSELARRAREAGIGIAYADEHMLVIEKPAGLVVHPARGHREGTLSQLLAGLAAGGDPQRAGIVHRLDRDTSGLMLVARSEPVHAALQAAIAARQVSREYLALVEGRPPSRTGKIEAPIGRDRRSRVKMAVGGLAPREAVTHFEVERELPRSTLLRLRLDTGRTHQIRVHLQAIGVPVAGDPDYGTPRLYGLSRQFLHSTRLALQHPVDARTLELDSPLPEDLRAALSVAERLS